MYALQIPASHHKLWRRKEAWFCMLLDIIMTARLVYELIVHFRDYKNVIEFFLVFQNGLQVLLGYIKDKDADKVSVALASSLDTIAELELLQVFTTNQ